MSDYSTEKIATQANDDDGYGTAYHDGNGFADCDVNNKGWRLCQHNFPEDKSVWCSECIYLNSQVNTKDFKK